jgi:hypothetical protein
MSSSCELWNITRSKEPAGRDSLVELFEDILHLAKPTGSIDIGLRHGFVQLNSFVKIVCRDRANA